MSIWISFSIVTELCVYFNCRKNPPVNCSSRVTVLWTSWNRNCQQKLRLATRCAHNPEAVWSAAGDGNFENPLKAQVVVNWTQCHVVKLHFYFKFIGYYSCFFNLFHLFSVILTLYSKFRAVITLYPLKIGHLFMKLCDHKGNRGGTVVKVPRYKSEGLWFDSRWRNWNFSGTQSFRSHYGLGIDSASNRN
jgi:hypothetical protein